MAIALVLGLSVFSASPELHERLHGHGPAASSAARDDSGQAGRTQDSQGDDGCVVTLFAQGLVLVLGVFAWAIVGRTARPTSSGLLDQIVPDAPRYLLLPTQAPPLGLS